MFVVDKGLIPEKQRFPESGLNGEQTRYQFVAFPEYLFDGLVRPLGYVVGHSGGQPEQFQQGLHRRDVPLSGTLNMLETDEISDRLCGKDVHFSGVELVTRDCERHITGIDQSGQQHCDPFQFETV